MQLKRRARVKIEHGIPILEERTRKTIQRLWERKPLTFKQLYERQRLHLQAEFSRLVIELTRNNIVASVEARLKETRRKKSLHVKVEIKGIKTTGNVNWPQAKAVVENSKERITTLVAELRQFWDASGGGQ
mgnify:FL=1